MGSDRRGPQLPTVFGRIRRPSATKRRLRLGRGRMVSSIKPQNIPATRPGDRNDPTFRLRTLPTGANMTTDNDCKAICGNGVKEGNELCDGDCPASCSGGTGCKREMLVGSSDACTATCMPTTITGRVNGDGCCPEGANSTNDSDCAPPPGCTRRSSENILQNPGFDTDLSQWSVGSGQGAIVWTSGDFETCSVSGSAQITVGNTVSRQIEQCVTVTGASTYYFNAKIKGGGSGELTTCQVATFNLTGCVGNSGTSYRIDWLNVSWGPTAQALSFVTDSATTSAKVSCFTDATDRGDAAAEIDFLYLGLADAKF